MEKGRTQAVDLHALLSEGERKGLGRIDEIIAIGGSNEEMFEELITSICDEDSLVAIRAADAVEKITRKHPELLAHWRKFVIKELTAITVFEVRWHVAQMIPRLKATPKQRSSDVALLTSWIHEGHAFVRTAAMTAALQTVEDDDELADLLELLDSLAEDDDSAAVRARARKLLRESA